MQFGNSSVRPAKLVEIQDFFCRPGSWPAQLKNVNWLRLLPRKHFWKFLCLGLPNPLCTTWITRVSISPSSCFLSFILLCALWNTHTTKMRKTQKNPLPYIHIHIYLSFSMWVAKLPTFPELGEIASNFGLNYINIEHVGGKCASWKFQERRMSPIMETAWYPGGKSNKMQQKSLGGETHIDPAQGTSRHQYLALTEGAGWD